MDGLALKIRKYITPSRKTSYAMMATEPDLEPESGPLYDRYASPTSLKFKTIFTGAGKHTAAIIFLHGLGDSGNGIWQYAKQMSADPALGHVKWIIPDAPTRPLTGSGGMIVPSWFDVLSFDIFTRPEDEPSLLSGVASINELITAEIKQYGIPPERIVVGGLSQGGALACLTGITSERRLAGVFVLSAYVPLWRKTKEIATPIAPSIPIFWGHGTSDTQVDCIKAFGAASDLARDLNIAIHMTTADRRQDDDVMSGTNADNDSGVTPLGLNPKAPGIRFNSYRGLVHWIDPVHELADLVVWIRGVVPMVEQGVFSFETALDIL